MKVVRFKFFFVTLPYIRGTLPYFFLESYLKYHIIQAQVDAMLQRLSCSDINIFYYLILKSKKE